VTREELRERLWSSETFVDFEQSLNTSIKELRAVLCDSATEPQYVETMPRLGYRFIAKVEVMESCASNGNSIYRDALAAPPLVEVPGATGGAWQQLETDADAKLAGGSDPSQESASGRRARPHWWRRRVVRVCAAGVTVLLAGSLIFRWLSSPTPPRALRITQLTHFGHVAAVGRIATDGARVFYPRRDSDRYRLMQVAVSGGESQPFLPGFENGFILDLAPDRSEFLVKLEPATSPWEQDLGLLPFVGGPLRRLSNLSGDDAIFFPDGQKIAYTKADGIYVCDRNGGNAHRLVSLPSISLALAWSPDGKVLRFTLQDTRTGDSFLWEVSSDGSHLHPLFPQRQALEVDCCGRWSTDGRYFFFISNKGEPHGLLGSVWAQREERSAAPWFKPSLPVRLTTAPVNFGDVLPSPDRTRLFALGIAHEQNELLIVSRDKKTASSVFNSNEVRAASQSPAGDWLAVIMDGWTLWRCRPDGTERTELAADLIAAKDVPRWSPDGHWIVFQGRREGHPSNIYKVNADGGPTQELLPNDERHDVPDWSPDGESIVYQVPREAEANPKEVSGVFILDLKSGKTIRIPESEDMADPQFSSDGRYLVGLAQGAEPGIVVFDFRTRRWKTAVRGSNFYRLRKTTDGEYFYYQEIPSPGEPIYRMHVGDWKVERVMSFESMLTGDVVRCRFAGVMRDGSLMVITVRGGYEIYSIDLDLP